MSRTTASTGIGVAAALGIPLTHREVAHGVSFVTGHGAEHDWQALVRSKTTLVIYMGLANLGAMVRALESAGMDPATPACLIENGTLGNQRQVVTRLDALSSAGFRGPALIVIGAVVALAGMAELRRKLPA